MSFELPRNVDSRLCDGASRDASGWNASWSADTVGEPRRRLLHTDQSIVPSIFVVRLDQKSHACSGACSD